MSRPLMRRRPTRAVIGATSLALAVTGLGGLFAGSASANPAGNGLVIQEVYVGGGNSGAPFTNDYIELYNPTGGAVDLTGWSVKYLSKAGSSGGTTTLSGSIASHGRYLIQEAKGSGGVSALPAPDATGSLAMSGTDGSVELLDGSAAVVDTVGFGAATVAEGAAMPALSNTTAGARTVLGADTDDNATDFSVVAPAPQNAAGQTAPSGVHVTAPGNKTFPAGTAITPIKLAATGESGSYTWAADGLPAGLTLQGDTISGTPTTQGTATVTVTATDATDDTVSGSATFTITVSAPPQQVAIADIQTTDPATSPLINQAVTTTGVVTADYATGGFNGFYLQTGGTGGTSDATPGASDAIFVYGSISAGQVKVGDSVSVTGTVQWYQGALEISSPAVTELADPLPAVTPASIAWSDLDDDAKKYAHEGELLAPAGDFTVTDNYNANFYGEIELAEGDQMLKQPTDVGTPGSQAAKDAAAYNASHEVFLDDGSSTQYNSTGAAKDQPLPWLTPSTPVSDGAKATFHQPVVLDYRNSQWNLQPQHQVVGDGSAVVTFSDMRTANAHPAEVGGDVRLATFNMENFFTTTGQSFVADNPGAKCTYYNDRAGNPIGDDTCTFADGSAGPRGAATDASYQRQLEKELTGIDGLGASVVSLEEVENSVKFGEDRDATVSALVDALNAKDGAGTWAYVPSPAAADLPPLASQDVIRTAFIYKPADITPVGLSHVLTDDSDAGQPFSIAREPMAQGFKASGAADSDAFMVVANHLKSKGADASSLFSDCGPQGTIVSSGGTDDSEPTDPVIDQGGFNCTRVHEVRDMWAWAQKQAASLQTSKIFLVGDFNAYDREDPIEYLYGQGFTDVGDHFDHAHSSYSYGGLEGSLDHVLASPDALKMATGASIWQIDAQESVAFAYSRYNYSGNDPVLFDGTTPWATSDHDPEVVGLKLATSSTPAPVVVKSPGNRSVVAGKAITPIVLSATGGSGSYTFSASRLPAGLTLKGDTISGTPTTAGVTSVTVTATDTADTSVTGTASFTIKVIASHPAPPHPTNPAHAAAVAHATKTVAKAQKKVKQAQHALAQAKRHHGAHSAAVKAAKKHLEKARKKLKAAKKKLAAVERQG